MKTIPLTQGKVALVDDEDFERMNQFKWQVMKNRNTFYATRCVWLKDQKKKKTLYMAREILRLSDPEIIADHINHNGLDNRKGNLRQCTHTQNKQNRKKRCKASSRFKGVHFFKRSNTWKSQISIKGKETHIGSFHNEHEAALAYNIAALNHFGEFAHINLP